MLEKQNKTTTTRRVLLKSSFVLFTRTCFSLLHRTNYPSLTSSNNPGCYFSRFPRLLGQFCWPPAYLPGRCLHLAVGWAGKCQNAFLTCLGSGFPSRDLPSSQGLYMAFLPAKARASHSPSGPAEGWVWTWQCGALRVHSWTQGQPREREGRPRLLRGRVTCASGRRGGKHPVYLAHLFDC